MLLITFILYFSGCTTVPKNITKPVVIEQKNLVEQSKEVKPIYQLKHKIEIKETLFKIAKMYDVDVDDLVKVNNIEDPTKIEIGQELIIPGFEKKKLILVDKVSKDEFIWPLKGRILNKFGQSMGSMVNKGIDIQPLYEDAQVVVAKSGKVVFVNDNFINLGKTIIVDHQDGFFTIYGRNSKVFVKPGDFLERGTVIAKVGVSSNDRRRFLHFQIRKGSVAKNPYFYLVN